VRRPFVGAALAAAIALSVAACGNPGGDILAIEVREPDGKVTRLVVTDDGRGSCASGELQRLDSDRLLEAREVEREFDELPGDESNYPGPAGRRRYRAEMRDAVVTWVEGAPGAPEAVGRATQLALNLRRDLCD
jgi:hypothetical protein